MHTDELLEACLQALSSGQEISPELARYLARHHEQRAEVEELILIAQRTGQLPQAEISPTGRERMQKRLAARMGVDPAMLDAKPGAQASGANVGQATPNSFTGQKKRWHLLSTGHLHGPFTSSNSVDPDEEATARIRKAFRNLTPEDIRRYIGDRGEDYLYYRQRFPRWEPVFAVLAAILRGFKQLEKLADFY